MVSTGIVVLSGVVAYTVVVIALEWTGRLPDGVSATGPLVTLRSPRGRSLLTWLARPATAWRLFATLSLVVVATLAVGMALGVVLAGTVTLLDPGGSPVSSPSTALVVPGVNAALPLAAAPELLAGVLIGLVVHEGAHGVLCRIEDIEIEDLGLVLLAVVPFAAFVQPSEPDEEDPAGWARMFAVAPVTNLVVTALAFGVLLAALTSITPAAGLAVGGTFEGAPAEVAGIERGDVITAVDGQPVRNGSDLQATLAESEGTVRVERRSAPAVDVQPRVTVIDATADAGIPNRATITAVNGSPVRTLASFRDALAPRPVARLNTSAGVVTLPMGVAGRVSENRALAGAGFTSGERVVITAVGGERVLDLNDLQATLDNTTAGGPLTISLFADGELQTRQVTPERGPGGRLLVGITPERGIGGLQVADFGVGEYPADEFQTALAGGGLPGDRSPLDRLLVFLTLPLAGLIGLAPYSFAGFLDPMTNAFAVGGPLAVLGSGVFTLANVGYWLAWLNVQVALFNCMPLWPLDGGRVLRIGAAGVSDRLGFERPKRVGTIVTAAVGVVLAVLLLAVLFLPALAG